MKRWPTISVITNFYNAERFIEETIESVLAQTYKSWELLLVNDGAADASAEIAIRYARQFPTQIRYLAHKGRLNLGASAARNLGIRHARGEYIALLDADDIWLPHKLKQQVEILGAWPDAAMLYGNTRYWYSWTEREEDKGRDFQPGIHVEPHTLLPAPGLLARILRQEAPVPCTCSVLLRRAAVLAVGGFEESFKKVFTDQVFYAKLLLKWPAVASGECWDLYRQHPDSCVSQVTAEGGIAAARLRYLRWLEKYLIGQGAAQTEAWRALQGELWTYRHPRAADFVKHLRPYFNQATDELKTVMRRTLPRSVYGWLKNQKELRRPAGAVK